MRIGKNYLSATCPPTCPQTSYLSADSFCLVEANHVIAESNPPTRRGPFCHQSLCRHPAATAEVSARNPTFAGFAIIDRTFCAAVAQPPTPKRPRYPAKGSKRPSDQGTSHGDPSQSFCLRRDRRSPFPNPGRLKTGDFDTNPSQLALHQGQFLEKLPGNIK